MNTRLKASFIGVMLCLLLTVTLFISAASSTDSARPSVRTTFASGPVFSPGEVQVSFIEEVQQQQVQDYLTARNYLTVRAYLTGQREIADYLAANRPAPVVTSAPRAPATVNYNSNPGDFLSCVRNRESRGNYGIYNSGGSGAAGAYQFMPGTWNSIAASSGRSDLVGVDPAQASPADQDAMAQALYAQQGAAPWGGGC